MLSKVNKILAELGIQILTSDMLRIPIRKWEYMYPDEFIVFNVGKYTFALYKSTTFTSVKTRNCWYIIPVVKDTENDWKEGNIHEIEELKQFDFVKYTGHYQVDGRSISDELKIFITQFQNVPNNKLTKDCLKAICFGTPGSADYGLIGWEYHTIEQLLKTNDGIAQVKNIIAKAKASLKDRQKILNTNIPSELL